MRDAATLLECGHLAEPWAGFGWGDPFGSTRECARCAREKGEGYRWQRVIVKDSDLIEEAHVGDA